MKRNAFLILFLLLLLGPLAFGQNYWGGKLGIVDARIDDPILRTGTFGATVGYGFEF